MAVDVLPTVGPAQRRLDTDESLIMAETLFPRGAKIVALLMLVGYLVMTPLVSGAGLLWRVLICPVIGAVVIFYAEDLSEVSDAPVGILRFLGVILLFVPLAIWLA